jgi:hypothetical protein
VGINMRAKRREWHIATNIRISREKEYVGRFLVVNNEVKFDIPTI